MDSAIEQFLSHLSGDKGYSENTVSAYRNDLTQFMQFLQRSDVGRWPRLRQQDILAYGLHLREREYKQSTLARKLASVRSFSHFLKDAGVVTDDPAEGLDSPQVARRTPRTLSDKEVALLLELPGRTPTAKGLRDRAILELLYATGMRVSEVTSLDLDDADSVSGSIICGRSTPAQRAIPLNPHAMEALRAYLDFGREELVTAAGQTALFVNHRGERLSRQGLWLVIKHYVKELGLGDNVTPHTLRHSAAAHRLSLGANITEVQHLLGHANPSSTQIYLRIARASRKEAAEPRYATA